MKLDSIIQQFESWIDAVHRCSHEYLESDYSQIATCLPKLTLYIPRTSIIHWHIME